MASYNDYMNMGGWSASPAVNPVMFNQTGAFGPTDMSSMMDWGNPSAGSNFRISELAQAPVTNAAFAMPGAVPGEEMSWSDRLFGSRDAKGMQTMGIAAPLMQGAGSLLSGFMGMKQYGLSKKIFENNKQQFERNFAAQKGLTNSQLSDRQDRRNADAAANGMSVKSTKDYMSEYGVK